MIDRSSCALYSGFVKPRRWSLLWRLVLWYSGSFGALILLSNIFVYYMLARSGEADRNAVLMDRLAAVSALLKSPSHGKEELKLRIKEEWPLRGGEKIYLRIQSGDGEILQTKGFPLELKDEMERLVREEPGEAAVHVNGPEGAKMLGRLAEMDNSIGMKPPVRVFGAIAGDQNEEFLEQYKRVALAIVICSTLISLAIGAQIARKGILPLRAMTVAVGRIRSGTLHERISPEDLPIELHQLALAFNQTLDSLEESFRRLAQFSSDIAHELRTPISNMLGELEVTLTKPRLGEEYHEILSSSLEECTRLKQIIESLLFLARAENRQGDFQMERVNIGAELASVIEFFEPSAAEAGIDLNLAAEGELAIMAEKTLFQRVVGNLLANAIRYTRAGGKITVRLRPEDSHFVFIEVADTGIGIGPDHLKRIFDRFYRVDTDRNWATGGVGLGLAIVKGIVDLHKGRIEIASEPGGGTRVSLHWPQA